MALTIHILDFGDIELEASFLVLGHDCGRVRRVPTYGFLILGGQYPVLVDTGFRDNAIMETLGMRGHCYHETPWSSNCPNTGSVRATSVTSCIRICTSTTPATTTIFP